ncbi:Unknown protein sequence [Pseudomonas syringae pv. syringae]|nr:Unknown protein sequence [Pseudomonas syringae pv. syringae]
MFLTIVHTRRTCWHAWHCNPYKVGTIIQLLDVIRWNMAFYEFPTNNARVTGR